MNKQNNCIGKQMKKFVKSEQVAIFCVSIIIMSI